MIYHSAEQIQEKETGAGHADDTGHKEPRTGKRAFFPSFCSYLVFTPNKHWLPTGRTSLDDVEQSGSGAGHRQSIKGKLELQYKIPNPPIHTSLNGVVLSGSFF